MTPGAKSSRIETSEAAYNVRGFYPMPIDLSLACPEQVCTRSARDAPRPALPLKNQVPAVHKEPARGPAADEGRPPHPIIAGVRMWENYVASPLRSRLCKLLQTSEPDSEAGPRGHPVSKRSVPKIPKTVPHPETRIEDLLARRL